MNTITTLFTPAQLVPVTEGIKQFTLLQGLIYDPNPLVWNTWLADESELKAALRSVADAFISTKNFLGKQKYVGVPFNPVDSVTKDMMLYLTAAEWNLKSATLRKRNLPMFILVIEPVISLFGSLTHQQMIDNAADIISDVCQLVDSSTHYGTYQDAMRVQADVHRLINQREAERKQAAKPPQSKKQRAMNALLRALGVDEVDEYVTP